MTRISNRGAPRTTRGIGPLDPGVIGPGASEGPPIASAGSAKRRAVKTGNAYVGGCYPSRERPIVPYKAPDSRRSCTAPPLHGSGWQSVSQVAHIGQGDT
jgi:hypothetical protein